MRNAQLARTLALRASINAKVAPAVAAAGSIRENREVAKAQRAMSRAAGRFLNALLDECGEKSMEEAFDIFKKHGVL